MSPTTRRSAAGILCAAACAAVLAAQQQRPPVFRGEAVLVTVDAYPQREGQIVEGLAASDFQVFEDGKPQTVESLEFVRIEPRLSDTERRDPNSVTEMLALAADPHNRVFVVFLDQLHVTVDGSHAIRRPLVDSLNRIIGADDLFGVMTQNTDPRALTLGRRLLSVEQQLAKHWDWGERYRLGLDVTDPMEDTLKACFEFMPRPFLPPWFVSDNGQKRYLYELLIDRRREDRTLTGLEGLVDRLAGMREARTVVLVITDGWRQFQLDRELADQAKEYGPSVPMIGNTGGRVTIGDQTPQKPYAYRKDCNDELVRLANLDNDRRLRDLTTRANRANVSFYPVTPSGLTVFDTPISQKSRPSLAEDGNRLRLRGDGLKMLADNTDGLAIVDANDLAGGMRRIVNDVSAYYLLGYYSTNTAHDGRFRRIDVKLKQQGVQVRARRGYLAPSDRPNRGGAIAAASSAGAAPAGLDDALGPLARLRTSADMFTRSAVGGGFLHVAVEIASSRAMSAPWNAGADVNVVVSPSDGSPVPAIGRIEPNSRGVLLAVPIAGAKPPFRVIARISAGGESHEDTTEAPAAPGILVGDAVFFRGRPAMTSPLRAVADLQYRRTERAHVEWALLGDLDQRSARLLGRNGQPLAVPVALTERETDGRRVLAADLNLAPLGAGDYVIELTIGRGAVTEKTLVAFRVVQ